MCPMTSVMSYLNLIRLNGNWYRNGYWVSRRMCERERDENVPFLLLTTTRSLTEQVCIHARALERGTSVFVVPVQEQGTSAELVQVLVLDMEYDERLAAEVVALPWA